MNIRGYIIAKWAVILHDHFQDMMTDTGKQFMECIDKLDGREVPYRLRSTVQSWTAVTESHVDRLVLPVALLRNEQKNVKARIIQGMATNWDSSLDETYVSVGMDVGSIAGSKMSADLMVHKLNKYKNEVVQSPTFDSSVSDAIARRDIL